MVTDPETQARLDTLEAHVAKLEGTIDVLLRRSLTGRRNLRLKRSGLSYRESRIDNDLSIPTDTMPWPCLTCERGVAGLT